MAKNLDEQYDEIADALENATPHEVDAIFEDIKKMDVGIRKYILQELEKIFNEFGRDIISESPSERQEKLAELKAADDETDPDKIKYTANEIAEVQSLLQVVLNVAKIKGDEACPFVKALVEEMKKLSSEEYNSQFGLGQAFYNAVEKLTPADLADNAYFKPAKTNPFAELDKPKNTPRRPQP